jgi:hypothetical protein
MSVRPSIAFLARLSFAATIVAAVAFMPFSANATIMKFLEIEELEKLSSDIFQGEVLSAGASWNADRTQIYTNVRVRIIETFKGFTRRNEVISVMQPGGERDGIRMDYAGRPEFHAGESVALFTVRGRAGNFIVVGLKQGKMRIEKDQVVRDFSGIRLVERQAGENALRPVTPKSTRLPMEEFRNRLSRARRTGQ